MKKLVLMFLTIFMVSGYASPDDFIITVQTDHYGESGFNQFTIPTNPSEDYDYAVDCDNDGIVEASNLTGDYTCEYDEIGEYTIRIIHDANTGLGFPSIQFGTSNNGNLRDNYKLVSVNQWGTGIWTNMAFAFVNTINFHDQTSDVPDFSQVIDMRSMFYNSKITNLNTTDWNVSNVSNMKQMFAKFPDFGGPSALPDVSHWNISSVTDISEVFRRKASNIPDISRWDTGLVINMSSIFPLNTGELVIPDISQWNTSSVTNMSDLFFNANNLPDISLWDTSSVTDMRGMFARVSNSIINVNNWDTSQVALMDAVFSEVFNVTLYADNWDTSSVTDMSYIFYGVLYSILNIKNWDTSAVTSMESMFAYNNHVIISSDNWDTSSVLTMQDMFRSGKKLDIAAFSWDLSALTNLSGFLSDTISVKLNFGQWRLPEVTSSFLDFDNIHLSTNDYDSFLINLNEYNKNSEVSLNVSHSQFCSIAAEKARSQLISRGWVINDAGKYCSKDSEDFIITVKGSSFDIKTNSLYDYNYNVDCNNDGILEAQAVQGDFTCNFSQVGEQGVYTIVISNNLNSGSGLPAFEFGIDSENASKILLVNNWGNSRWQSMKDMFSNTENLILANRDIPDFSEVTSFASMFENNELIDSLEANDWITSSATDMSYMFKQTNIRDFNINNWDTGQVSNMGGMFSRTLIRNLDVRNWDISSVSNMSNMFSGVGRPNINFSQWNTSSVTDMNSIFSFTGLHNLDISEWNTLNVTDMSRMFSYSDLSNVNISQWNTANVTDMSHMFDNANGFNQSNNLDLDIKQWDTSSVTNMNNMFYEAKFSKIDISDWDTSLVRDMSNMFNKANIDDLKLGILDIGQVNLMDNIFDQFSLLTDTYDALLEGFANQNVQNDVFFGAEGNHFCSEVAAQARSNLSNNNDWTITDDGYQCPNHFIMTVKTDNSGHSADNQFTIPINPFETGYNYAVDCDNDGFIEADMLDDSYTCDFPEPGTYDVRVLHDELSNDGFPAIYFNNSGDALKLLSIKQWGSNPWMNLNHAFSGARNLVIVTEDQPNILSISDMTGMFDNVKLSINIYDSLLIHFKDTAKVRNLNFSADSSTYCSAEASAAKSYLMDELNWLITDGGWQCYQAPESDLVFTVFLITDQVIINPSFHTPNAVIDYNVDCDNDGVLEFENVQGAINCRYDTSQLYSTQKIRIEHNLANGEGFPSLYFDVNNSNELFVSINQWGTGKWKSMEKLFQSNYKSFWVDSKVPNTSDLLSTESMFANASNINIDVSNWDLSNVTNMSRMFYDSDINLDISNWDTSNVQDMSSLFHSAEYVFPGIANWDISSVTNMDNIFRNAPLSNELYDQILINFGSQNVNNGLTLDVGDTQYCSQEALDAKNHLINTFNWTIIDGGDCDFIFANGFE